jgi:hypothetical protein
MVGESKYVMYGKYDTTGMCVYILRSIIYFYQWKLKAGWTSLIKYFLFFLHVTLVNFCVHFIQNIEN